MREKIFMRTGNLFIICIPPLIHFSLDQTSTLEFKVHQTLSTEKVAFINNNGELSRILAGIWKAERPTGWPNFGQRRAIKDFYFYFLRIH